MFRAYNKATGEVVAEIELPERTSGAPMTYMYKGRQYIVIAVATRQHPAELVALALPEKGKPRTPPNIVTNDSITAVVATGASTAILNNGRRVFASGVAMCSRQRAKYRRGAPPIGNQSVQQGCHLVSKGGVNMPPMQTMLTGGTNPRFQRVCHRESAQR